MVKEIVFCAWCEAENIVEITEEYCPSCNEKGYLAWKDGIPKEIEE